MRELTITKNDADQRLDRFLQKAVPLLPGSLAQKYIRQKRIKRNGKRTEQNCRLIEGDILQFYISDEFFETSQASPASLPGPRPNLHICHEDDHILIAEKPPGLLSHSGNTQGEPTLIDQIKSYLYHTGQWNPETEQSFTPALCNRLDRNTGGLILAAKTAPSLKILNEKIRTHEIDKYYLLAVHGRPDPPAGRIEGHISKDARQNKVTVSAIESDHTKSAVTVYKTLETRDNLSLVECRLETGRTHQIRAQMAFLGCPLLGDPKYGCPDQNKSYAEPHQALWAHRIRFSFSSDAGVLNYLNHQEFTSSNIPFLSKYFLSQID